VDQKQLHLALVHHQHHSIYKNANDCIAKNMLLKDRTAHHMEIYSGHTTSEINFYDVLDSLSDKTQPWSYSMMQWALLQTRDTLPPYSLLLTPFMDPKPPQEGDTTQMTIVGLLPITTTPSATAIHRNIDVCSETWWVFQIGEDENGLVVLDCNDQVVNGVGEERIISMIKTYLGYNWLKCSLCNKRRGKSHLNASDETGSTCTYCASGRTPDIDDEIFCVFGAHSVPRSATSNAIFACHTCDIDLLVSLLLPQTQTLVLTLSRHHTETALKHSHKREP
jgi:hypothetical protein